MLEAFARSAIRRFSRAIAGDILDNTPAAPISVLLEKYKGENYDRPRSRTLATVAQIRTACTGGCSSAWLYPMGFERAAARAYRMLELAHRSDSVGAPEGQSVPALSERTGYRISRAQFIACVVGGADGQEPPAGAAGM